MTLAGNEPAGVRKYGIEALWAASNPCELDRKASLAALSVGTGTRTGWGAPGDAGSDPRSRLARHAWARAKLARKRFALKELEALLM